jgi:chemotaxis-related protein WspB
MLVLTFQVSNEAMAVDIRRVREVVPRVQLQAVRGAPDWLAGVFIYRGIVIPTIDLYRLAGAGECPLHLSSRIILVTQPGSDGREQVFGLLAAHVADIRTIAIESSPVPETPIEGHVNFGPVISHENGVLRLLDPDRLLSAAAWRQLLALTAGAAA